MYTGTYAPSFASGGLHNNASGAQKEARLVNFRGREAARPLLLLRTVTSIPPLSRPPDEHEL